MILEPWQYQRIIIEATRHTLMYSYNLLSIIFYSWSSKVYIGTEQLGNTAEGNVQNLKDWNCETETIAFKTKL